MGIGKKIAVGVGGLLGVVIVAGVGGFVWASSSASTKLAAVHDVHRVDFPIPFPLTDSEIEALRAERAAAAKGSKGTDVLAGVDLNAIATERAVARGKHLTEAIYGCTGCHGLNFGGGTMVDDPAIGKILGQNLTLGTGSRTLKYTAADWDRMVRHGVKPDGSGSPMPSKDFFAMSDQELSDIVSYIRSMPPVNKEVPAVMLGPLGKVLVATGQITLSADQHPTKHVIDHAKFPPPSVADATFGKHIAQTCSGCHRDNFAGGPIVGGPPDWPPARNLTPTGLGGYAYEDFARVLREGRRKSGEALLEPMAGVTAYTKNMTDVEVQALWAFLKDLPPTPTNK